MSATDAICIACGKTFQKAPGAQFDMCPACLQQTASRYASPTEAAAAPAPRSKAGLWVALGVSIGIIIVQVPRVKSALAILFPPPAGNAPVSDPRGQCLSNLWSISSLLQKNTWPAGAWACPASGAPYRTQRTEKDVVVSCPNPAAHGFKVLHVSRHSPTPQAS